jgi:hypothetical protein
MSRKQDKQSKQDYDWLNDPFDEEKSTREQIEAQKGANRGCFIAIIVLIIVGLFILGIGFFGLLYGYAMLGAN